MQHAAIGVGPEHAEESIALCRATCEDFGWDVAPDRVAVLNPDHPDLGLPLVLSNSYGDWVDMLVVPTWEEIARGLFGSLYHTQSNVKGKNSRVVGTGMLTARRFFEELAERPIGIHVVKEGRTFLAKEVVDHLRDSYEPMMATAAEWDAQLSKKIRAGQDTAWGEGRRVGRPPRQPDSRR